jgi:hypothetical protein
MSSDAIRMEIEALATGLQPVDLMEFHGSPILQKLIDVISEPVVWIWKYRIPLGKLTLLAGFPGLGKSLAACSIAAILSTGRYWPDRLSGPPPLRGSTIFLNYEDDPGDTLRPRLEAAGADLTRISIHRPFGDVMRRRERQKNHCSILSMICWRWSWPSREPPIAN